MDGDTPAAMDFVVSSVWSPVTVQGSFHFFVEISEEFYGSGDSSGACGGVHGGIPRTVPQLPVQAMGRAGRCALDGIQHGGRTDEEEDQQRGTWQGCMLAAMPMFKSNACVRAGCSKIREECTVFLGAMHDGSGTAVGPTRTSGWVR